MKWNFETRVLPSDDFFVNAVYLRIMTLAYNLCVALKTILPEPYHKCRLKALLFGPLAILALITSHARRMYLELSRCHPHLLAIRATFASHQTLRAQTRNARGVSASS